MSKNQTTKRKLGSVTHFFDLFPTPKFLEMSAPGLAVEDGVVRFVEFSHQGKNLILKRYDSMKIPQGAIIAGEIVNPEILISTLNTFREKNNLNYVRCSLPEEKSYLFFGRIPKVGKSEIRTAVEFIIEENVPLSVSESVFDYTVIGGGADKNGEYVDVSVSVVSQEVVMQYLEIFKKANLTPLHFEIESQAVGRAVIKTGNKTPHLIINFFDGKIGLYIESGGIIYFSSTIPIAPVETTPSDNLAEDKNKKEEKKETKASTPEIIKRPLPSKEIKSETERIISYWNSMFEKRGDAKIEIKKMIVCGLDARNPDIEKNLAFLGMEMCLANVWENAFSFNDHIPEISRNESLEYAVTVGLALPSAVIA